MNSAPNPIVHQARTTLRTAIIWLVASVVVAIYAGISTQPSVAYTVGAAIVGVVWVFFLVIHWRTRRTLWSIFSIIIFVIGMSVLRDTVFPGGGFLRGIYALAVAVAVPMLLLRLLRGHVSRFCYLDS